MLSAPATPILITPTPMLPSAAAMDGTVRQLGWFVAVEGGVVDPHLGSVKTSSDGAITFLAGMSSLNLDWGPVGEVDLGYRFPAGNGVRLSYRAFDSSGHTESTGNAAFLEPTFFLGLNNGVSPGLLYGVNVSPAIRDLRTELQFNRIDLDYLSAAHAFGDTVRLAWILGARLVVLRVDAVVDDAFTLTNMANQALGLTVHQGATDLTTAGGAHAGLDACWTPGGGPMGAFGLLDAGILGGGSTQRYSVGLRTASMGAWDSGSTHGGSLIGTFNLQAGLQYDVPLWRTGTCLRVRGGYEFEMYDFTATGSGAGKHALYKRFDLTDHGLFLRAELPF